MTYDRSDKTAAAPSGALKAKLEDVAQAYLSESGYDSSQVRAWAPDMVKALWASMNDRHGKVSEVLHHISIEEEERERRGQ